MTEYTVPSAHTQIKHWPLMWTSDPRMREYDLKFTIHLHTCNFRLTEEILSTTMTDEVNNLILHEAVKGAVDELIHALQQTDPAFNTLTAEDYWRWVSA